MIALFSSCISSWTEPDPTNVSEILDVTLWVEWPVVPYSWAQVVHVVVTDKQGDTLTGATVLGKFIAQSGDIEVLVFPLTDSEGYTTILIDNGARASDLGETHRIEVQATWKNGYGRAWHEYQTQP